MNIRHGLEIRAANNADASGLCELLGLAGHTVAPRIMADRLAAIRQDAGTALVAMKWGAPTGLVLSHWYQTLSAGQPVAQITELLVNPDERRQGIGRLLIKAAAHAARVAGCDLLEVLVPPGDESLREFCRATGFVDAGPRFARGLRKKL